MTESEHQPLTHKTRGREGGDLDWKARCACGWQSPWECSRRWAEANLTEHFFNVRQQRLHSVP